MDTPLRTVKSNIVQSIRAHRVQDLHEAAQHLGHHFLYANLAVAQSKQDVLDMLAQQFTFPPQTSKNFDALFDGMTVPQTRARHILLRPGDQLSPNAARARMQEFKTQIDSGWAMLKVGRRGIRRKSALGSLGPRRGSCLPAFVRARCCGPIRVAL